MDRELWTLILASVKRAAKEIGWNGGRRAPRYPNWLIVAMYLWAVWHDRTMSWACDRGHYAGLFRPRGVLPSISQFTRRIKSEDCQAILQRVHEAFAQRGLATDEGYVDGKPLLVSPVSKDPDAKRGKISGGFGKGYKLHAFVNEHRRIVIWCVTGLNADEKTVAIQMLPYLPPITPQGLILKDSNYDSAPLHKAAEALMPHAALVGPLRGQDRVGVDGHHPVTLRQMGPRRRELLAAWHHCPDLLHLVLRARDTIERVFGVLCCTAGGLGTAPPPWVRTLERVRRWVGAKIILYNARLEVQDRLQSKAAV